MRAKTKTRKSIVCSISAVMTMLMIAFSIMPAEVRAEDQIVYPNSATLEALINDRSFVVDTLTVGVRDEEDYGGTGFSNNPHFFNLPNHFIYEDLLNMYEDHIGLKAMVEIYKVKSDLENYPMETLLNASKNTTGLMGFMGQMLDTAASQDYSDMNQALVDAYEIMGGKFPTVETLKSVNKKIASDDDWADYDKSGLSAVQKKDGTAAYYQYKESLEESEDNRDEFVLSTLDAQESEIFSIAKPIMKYFSAIVEGLRGAEITVDGETIKTAKIYDVILSDIFQSEYTSSLGFSVGKESEAKAEMDETTQILKNDREYLSHISDLIDLDQMDSQKVMIDNYLDYLKQAGGDKVKNINAAFDTMNGSTNWMPAAADSIRTLDTTALYQTFDPTGDEDDPVDEAVTKAIKDAKGECDEMYLLHSRTSDFISAAKKTMDLYTDTLANYYLIDTLVRENEYIRGVLERSAQQESGMADSGWQKAVEKYRKLLDMSDPDVDSQIFQSILQTAIDRAGSAVEKSAGKLIKSAATRAVIETGKNEVARAKIAQSLSHVSVVYSTVDMLDDYVAGLQDVAEKIYEIKYLLNIQQYAYEAYQQDVAAYQAESDPFVKDELAGKALADLQFLKQIKLRQIEDGYQALDGLKNETLSGKIASFFDEYGGATTMDADYQDQMDAITQMMICPVGGTPFKIAQGNTMTIKKQFYGEGRWSHYGIVRDSKGDLIGRIAEIDLLAAGGLNIQGTLVIEDDILLPELVGNGNIKVEDGAEPVIGYINGDLTALSDLHVKGTVNGSVKVGEGCSSIVIDGNVNADSYYSYYDDAESGRANILIHGDLYVDHCLSLQGINMTVEGKSRVSMAEEATSSTYMAIKYSTFCAKDEFTYNGTSDSYNKNLQYYSRLELWDMSYFPMRSNSFFQPDDTSAVVMKGDGTAGLVGYPRSTGSTEFSSVRFGDRSYFWDADVTATEPEGLIFETSRIRTLQNVTFAGYIFPENIHVKENSSVALIDNGTDVNGLVFEKDLTIPQGGRIAACGVQVNGDTYVRGTFEAIGYRLKYPAFHGKGNLIIGDGGADIAGRAGFPAGTELPDGPAYLCRALVEGDLVVENGEIIPGHLTVNGDATLEKKGCLNGHDSNMGIGDVMIVNGFFTHKGTGTTMERLYLRGGANFEMLPPEEDYEKFVENVYLQQGEKPCQEIRMDDAYQFYELYADNAVCSFPEGLRFYKIIVEGDDGALTIKGDVPFFDGAYQDGPGMVVFEDDVQDFSVASSYETGVRNHFHHIWAKKDLRVTADMDLYDPYSGGTGSQGGTLRVDGTLIAADGASINFNGQKAELGILATEPEGYIHINFLDELKLGGIREAYPGNISIDMTKETIWTGGDIELTGDNDEELQLRNFTLKSDRIPKISAGKGSISIDSLDIDGPGFDVEGEVSLSDITSSRESFTVKGDLENFWGGGNALKSPELRRIVFDDVRHLEQGRVNFYSADICWDVTRFEIEDDALSYDAEQYIRDLPENVCRVRYCYKDIYQSETRYYKKGSLIIPLVTYESLGEGSGESIVTIVDPLYEDKEETIPVSLESLTTRQLTGDLDLFWQFSGDLPESFEGTWWLRETEVRQYWSDNYDLTLEPPVEWSGDSHKLSYRWYMTDITGEETELTEFRNSKWCLDEAPVYDVLAYRCEVSDPKDPGHTETVTYNMEISESGDYLWGYKDDYDLLIEDTPESMIRKTVTVSPDKREFTIKFTGRYSLFAIESDVPAEVQMVYYQAGSYWRSSDFEMKKSGEKNAILSMYSGGGRDYYIQFRVKDYDGSQDGKSFHITVSGGELFSGEMQYTRNKPARLVCGLDTWFWEDSDGTTHEGINLPYYLDGDIVELKLIDGSVQKYVFDGSQQNWIPEGEDYLSDVSPWGLDYCTTIENDFPYELGKEYLQTVTYQNTGSGDALSASCEIPYTFIASIGEQSAALPDIGDLSKADAEAVLDFQYTVDRYAEQYSSGPEYFENNYGFDYETLEYYQNQSTEAFERMKEIMGADWPSAGQDPDDPGQDKIKISSCSVTGIRSSYIYTGSAITPKVKVTDGEKELQEGEDYTVSFENNKNAGTATVLIKGTKGYTGTIEQSFEITPKAVKPVITLEKPTFTYNGKVQKPRVTIKIGKTKVAASGYQLKYTGGCKKVGRYKVTASLTGNYKGSVSTDFVIAPKGTTVSKVTAGKKTCTVKWKKQTSQVTGYQIQCSLNSKFKSGNKTLTVKGAKKTSLKIKSLKSKKKYYVRIRTYKTAGGQKICSAWSKARTVKVK